MKRERKIFLFTLVAVLLTACSSPEKEPVENMVETGSSITREEPETQESIPVSQTKVAVGSLKTEIEEIVNNLKTQAENDAEKDRNSIMEALGNPQADARWSEACGFIKDQYPDYFSSDDLIQKSIKYGHYLAVLYKEYEGMDNGYGRYYEMGQLLSQAAQDIYTGISTPADASVMDKLQELEKQFQFFYGTSYGTAAASSFDDTFTAEDVYVIGNPILSDCLFLKVNMDAIKNIEANLSRCDEAEHANGHYIYWAGDGITYVSHSTMDGDLYGVILTSDQFQLGCGLKAGMDEDEIVSLKPQFVRCSKSDYPMDSLFLTDASCPLNALDYDTIYLYQFGEIPEDARKVDSIITGGRISITALVKDGKVISVFTNIPVAG